MRSSPSRNSPEKPKGSPEKPKASPEKPKVKVSQERSNVSQERPKEKTKTIPQQKSSQQIQQVSKSASKQLPPPPPPVVEETTPEDVWVEVKDEGTGKSYWWNQESNETTALDAPKPVGYTARSGGTQQPVESN